MDTFLLEEFLLKDLQPLFLGTNHAPDVDRVLESAQEFVASLPSLGRDDQTLQELGVGSILVVRTMRCKHRFRLFRPRCKPHLHDHTCKPHHLHGLNFKSNPPGTGGHSERHGRSPWALRKVSGTWKAHIWLPDYNFDREKRGMQCYTRGFETEEEAKQAHNKVAIRFNLRVNWHNRPYKLNYPQELYVQYIAEHAHWSRRDFLWKIRRDSTDFSRATVACEACDC